MFDSGVFDHPLGPAAANVSTPAHRDVATRVASVMQRDELDSIRQRLLQLPEPPPVARLGKTDWIGALGVFLFVFLSTFPVALPFIFMHNDMRAMRLSNAIAVLMLFITGLAYGRAVGRSPWGFGISMVLLGGALVALTIALGG